MSTKRRGFWQRRIERSTPFPFDRGGDVGPQASSGVTNGSAGKNATRQPTPLSASRLDGAPRKGTTTLRGGSRRRQ